MNKVYDQEPGEVDNRHREQIEQEIQERVNELVQEAEQKYLKKILDLEKDISHTSSREKKLEREISHLQDGEKKAVKEIDAAINSLRSLSTLSLGFSDSSSIDSAVRHLETAKKELSYSSSLCWIFTAYYGDPQNADLIELKQLRDHLMSIRTLGGVFDYINKVYDRMGRRSFARKFAVMVQNKDSYYLRFLIKFISDKLVTLWRRRVR